MVATGLAAVHTEILADKTTWKYTVSKFRGARSRILVQFIVTGFAH